MPGTAPDLDSVGPSPRLAGPPSVEIPVAGGSGGGGPAALSSSFPSLSRRVSRNSNTMRRSSASYGNSSSFPASAMEGGADNTGVGSGPGPLRHLQPLTIAELHLELEKEQEAVVNRLSRELTLLRQQTASVASTASSTSLNNHPPEHSQPPPISGRHRSSSTRSSWGVVPSQSRNVADSAPGMTPVRDGGAHLSSRRSLDQHRGSFSHEHSVTASPFQQYADQSPYSRRHSQSQMQSYPRSHRSSVSFPPQPNTTTQLQSPSLSEHIRSGSSPSSPPALSRYEEVSHYRAELEDVRRENETLRGRVRELEATVRRHPRYRECISSGVRDDEVTDITSNLVRASIA